MEYGCGWYQGQCVTTYYLHMETYFALLPSPYCFNDVSISLGLGDICTVMRIANRSQYKMLKMC